MKGTTKIFAETMDLVNKLSGNMDKMTNELNNAMNQLPPEKHAKISKHQSKINQLMKVAKTGDLSKMQEIIDANADILKNHAGTNNTK